MRFMSFGRYTHMPEWMAALFVAPWYESIAIFFVDSFVAGHKSDDEDSLSEGWAWTMIGGCASIFVPAYPLAAYLTGRGVLPLDNVILSMSVLMFVFYTATILSHFSVNLYRIINNLFSGTDKYPLLIQSENPPEDTVEPADEMNPISFTSGIPIEILTPIAVSPAIIIWDWDRTIFSPVEREREEIHIRLISDILRRARTGGKKANAKVYEQEAAMIFKNSQGETNISRFKRVIAEEENKKGASKVGRTAGSYNEDCQVFMKEYPIRHRDEWKANIDQCLVPNVRPALEEFQRRGAKQIIVTANSWLTLELLEDMGIGGYFQGVMSSVSWAGRGRYTKKAAFRKILKDNPGAYAVEIGDGVFEHGKATEVNAERGETRIFKAAFINTDDEFSASEGNLRKVNPHVMIHGGVFPDAEYIADTLGLTKTHWIAHPALDTISFGNQELLRSGEHAEILASGGMFDLIISDYADKLHEYENIVRDRRILDLGTGVGQFAFWAEGAGAAEITGIDHSIDSVKIARRLARERNSKVIFEEGSVTALENKFDTIIAARIWEFISKERSETVLKDCFELLSRKGSVLLLVQNESVYLLGKDGKPSTPKISGDKSWTHADWRKTLEDVGFCNIEINYLWENDGFGTTRISTMSIVTAKKTPADTVLAGENDPLPHAGGIVHRLTKDGATISIEPPKPAEMTRRLSPKEMRAMAVEAAKRTQDRALLRMKKIDPYGILHYMGNHKLGDYYANREVAVVARSGIGGEPLFTVIYRDKEIYRYYGDNAAWSQKPGFMNNRLISYAERYGMTPDDVMVLYEENTPRHVKKRERTLRILELRLQGMPLNQIAKDPEVVRLSGKALFAQHIHSIEKSIIRRLDKNRAEKAWSAAPAIFFAGGSTLAGNIFMAIFMYLYLSAQKAAVVDYLHKKSGLNKWYLPIARNLARFFDAFLFDMSRYKATRYIAASLLYAPGFTMRQEPPDGSGDEDPEVSTMSPESQIELFIPSRYVDKIGNGVKKERYETIYRRFVEMLKLTDKERVQLKENIAVASFQLCSYKNGVGRLNAIDETFNANEISVIPVKGGCKTELKQQYLIAVYAIAMRGELGEKSLRGVINILKEEGAEYKGLNEELKKQYLVAVYEIAMKGERGEKALQGVIGILKEEGVEYKELNEELGKQYLIAVYAIAMRGESGEKALRGVINIFKEEGVEYEKLNEELKKQYLIAVYNIAMKRESGKKALQGVIGILKEEGAEYKELNEKLKKQYLIAVYAIAMGGENGETALQGVIRILKKEGVEYKGLNETLKKQYLIAVYAIAMKGKNGEKALQGVINILKKEGVEYKELNEKLKKQYLIAVYEIAMKGQNGEKTLRRVIDMLKEEGAEYKDLNEKLKKQYLIAVYTSAMRGENGEKSLQGVINVLKEEGAEYKDLSEKLKKQYLIAVYEVAMKGQNGEKTLRKVINIFKEEAELSDLIELPDETLSLPERELIHTKNFRTMLGYIRGKETDRVQAEKDRIRQKMEEGFMESGMKDKATGPGEDEFRPDIIAVGKSWLKGYIQGNDKCPPLNPLISKIRVYCERRNIPFILADDDDLPGLIAQEKAQMSNKTKVVILAGANKEGILSQGISGLAQHELYTVVGVDGSDLTPGSYIRIMELLTVALGLSIDIHPSLDNEHMTILPPEGARNCYIIVPHSEPMKYELLKAIYDIQKNA